jgi:phosphatidate cytidylyltransferase
MVRVASAVVILLVLAATVWWLPLWATPVVAALVAALGAHELAAIAGALGVRVPPWFLAAGAAAFSVAFVLDQSGATAGNLRPLIAVSLAYVIAAGAIALTRPPDAQGVTRAAVLFMAPLYVGLPLGAIASIRWTDGAMALALLVVLMVVSDSAQYYTGRTFGRRQLAPLVSPAKTVEGAIGGLVATAIAGALLVPRWITPAPPSAAAMGAGLGLVLATVGMIGDLFESSLKRSAGVKDSSALIPGHGGVLDRIDSYLFAAPMYFLFLRYVA